MRLCGCVLSALMLILPAAGPAAAQSVTVLGRVVLGESRLDGQKIGEFSALVRDPAGDGVIAVSDRGYLARLDLTFSAGRLTGVTPRAVHLLRGPDGRPLRDDDFNPEGAALMPDGGIAIVAETGPRLAVFDTEGRWLREELLPEALRDAARQSSPKDGVEALAWTAQAGFIALTEEPQAGRPRDLHALHSTQAGSAEFLARETDSVSIKGMETAGGRLVLLERSRDDATRALRPALRLIVPEDCLGRPACPTRRLPLVLEGLVDADFEGIAALGDRTFLIVSDDRIDGALRSVFVLLRLED